MNLFFDAEDACQIAIGAFALSIPIAYTQEAWDLSVHLPLTNVVSLAILSLFFLTIFTYFSVFRGNVKLRIPSFVLRISLAYIITLLVVTVLLLAIDKLPIMQDPLLAVKRVVIIAMPASLGAIIVDSLDKE